MRKHGELRQNYAKPAKRAKDKRRSYYLVPVPCLFHLTKPSPQPIISPYIQGGKKLMHSPNLLGVRNAIPFPTIPKVTKMIENMRLNSLVFIAFCAVVPALAQAQAQTQTVRSSVPRPPYTVEFKTTNVLTLANGTVITTEIKEVVARDQDGRRMSSTTNPPTAGRPAITNVHVSDPVTGEDINWNSLSKVAHEVKRPVGAARQGCWATPDGRYRANYGHSNTGASAQPLPLEPPSPPPGTAMPAASPLASDPNAFIAPDGKKIVVVGVKPAPGEAAPAAPAKNDAIHEDLGADNILGVQVRGSRTTTTTPAGAQGNDQPLVRTDEYWMAPSLGMMLRSITEDPRMGKMTREAVSVDLTNPEPALFQPPADYKLETEVMQPVACRQ
jgi:hypothetical protein